MYTKKTKLVTAERLEQHDHYRAQVQLPDKLVWAILYNSIYDRNPDLAAGLRDALGSAVAKVIIDHFNTLMAEPAFREFHKEWVATNVEPGIQPTIKAWLKKTIGY